jgi:hypothetical protein
MAAFKFTNVECDGSINLYYVYFEKWVTEH